MRPAIGFLFSSAIAALCVLSVIFASAGGTVSFEEITSFIFLWSIATAVTVLTTFAPFFIAWGFAERNGINSVWYFVVCSVMTVLALNGLISWANHQLGLGDPDGLSFIQAYVRGLPSLLTGAVVGGLVYWAVSGRRIKPIY